MISVNGPLETYFFRRNMLRPSNFILSKRCWKITTNKKVMEKVHMGVPPPLCWSMAFYPLDLQEISAKSQTQFFTKKFYETYVGSISTMLGALFTQNIVTIRCTVLHYIRSPPINKEYKIHFNLFANFKNSLFVEFWYE